MAENVLLSLEEQIRPAHTAVIVVDPQKDFCASGGATATLMGSDVSRIQAAVKRLNPFIEKAREMGVDVFWTRSAHTKEKTSAKSPTRRNVSTAAPVSWIARRTRFRIESPFP